MRHGLRLATLENLIDISAPAEDVFDFVMDVRSGPLKSAAAGGRADTDARSRVPNGF